jgi:hypothetical protein
MIIIYLYNITMNGIDNPSSTIQHEKTNPEEIINIAQDETLKKNKSPLTILSLTLHSLGIIFGDM